ncbi:MAG: polysaccharide deacetylase family protein [Bacteroidia bacterium]
MAGIFTISLDFELHWGVFDKRDRDSRKQNYDNTIKTIPELLRLFSVNNVHVTWATVGALFVNNESELNKLLPANKLRPTYKNNNLSAYNFIAENSLDDTYNWAHFAPEQVKQISGFKGQELASHTFLHYYCLEPGQNVQQFSADLEAAKKAAEAINEKLVSLVFPRNQFNEEYLDACYAHGIKVVRSNPDSWFWSDTSENTSIFSKIFRTGDTYIPMGKNTSYTLDSLEVKPGKPLLLPASRFLRPYNPKYKFLNKLRLDRILKEMEHAAKHNECYHLWWHPENFGDHPAESLKDIHVIIEKFRALQNQYGMISWNMKEYAEHFKI